MALTPAETQQLARVLAELPLASATPAMVTDMANMFDSIQVPAGNVFFDTRSPVGTLYLLVEGNVVQTNGTSSQPWYQKELGPGEFFGQRSLVSGEHQTNAVATAPSTVFTMRAADLSLLLDRYPALREPLWKETRASRVRSVPLFESLSDDDISWLAELVEELLLPASSQVPLDSRPGLWIVDRGQVEVAGPAAALASFPEPLPGNEPVWVITAGNFFFALQAGARFGGKCAATWARTVRNTKFLFLDDRHFNRMLAALPGVRPMIDEPLDIPALIDRVPLFSGPHMTEDHRRHLAQFCAWEFVPANQNISAQGAVGYSFIEVLRGAALVSAVDDRGKLRPVHKLQAGDSYGRTSLLDSAPRNATVRAVAGGASAQGVLNGAEILNLDRRDLLVAFQEKPALWHPGIELYDHYRRVKDERPAYPWLGEGETVLWTDRSHSWWLVWPLVAWFLSMIVVLGGLTSLLSMVNLDVASMATIDLLLLGVVFLPIAIYIVWNYRDDYYAVTNRRITRHDRVPFASDMRIESPLETIQDVTYNTTFWGRVLDFGDVTVRTAAKVGSLVFNNVPNPDFVVDRIATARAQAAVAKRGSTKEALRQGLISDLRLALPVPDLDSLRAIGDDPAAAPPATGWRLWQQRLLRKNRPRALPLRKPKYSTRRRLLARLPKRWSDLLLPPEQPKAKPLGDPIVWQKHWLNLIQRGSAAFLSLVGLVIFGLFLFSFGQEVFRDLYADVVLAWLLLLGASAVWFWYHYTDWRNDLYIVTDEKIIDVEKKPLALSTNQRESSLDVIQSVDSKQPTFWSKFLNYGDVVIRTAASDEGFTFRMVPAPMLVQKTVFQKLDAFRRRQEARRVDERRRDVVEGLQVYHELRQDAQR